MEAGNTAPNRARYIETLIGWGFTLEEAEKAANGDEIDWNAPAVRAADAEQRASGISQELIDAIRATNVEFTVEEHEELQQDTGAVNRVVVFTFRKDKVIARQMSFRPTAHTPIGAVRRTPRARAAHRTAARRTRRTAGARGGSSSSSSDADGEAARVAAQVALDALEAGDQHHAVAVLLDLVDGPSAPRRYPCQACGATFEWPGLRDRHLVAECWRWAA
jgi:hypothetical protein